MKYLFIDGSYDAKMVDLTESFSYVHLWNNKHNEPKWYTNKEAPDDVMREYSDMYLKIHVGLWFNSDNYVYLWENSTLEIKDLLSHILSNYKKE